ncbi:MAG: hypothetical protein FWH55_05950 [Oscillospiraceae bacterium]|nr:hypothetical protein [Oscillospiraceae bacterium]
MDAKLEVCDNCASKVPFYTGRFLMEDSGGRLQDSCDRVVCALKYTDMVKAAMMRFKFSQRPEFGRVFGAFLAEKIAREEREGVFSIVTSVPLSKERERERGYNQAEIIARYIALYLNVTYMGALLRRNSGTLRQSGLNGAERSRNAKGSFVLNDSDEGLGFLKGRTILLVDDVSTTLSTINAGASALKAGGAAIVVGAVATSGMAGGGERRL